MASKAAKCFKCYFALILLLLVSQTECGRTGGGRRTSGGGRTSGGSRTSGSRVGTSYGGTKTGTTSHTSHTGYGTGHSTSHTGYGSTGRTGYGSTSHTGYGTGQSTSHTGYGSTGHTGYGSTSHTGYGTGHSNTGYGSGHSTSNTGSGPPRPIGFEGFGNPSNTGSGKPYGTGYGGSGIQATHTVTGGFSNIKPVGDTFQQRNTQGVSSGVPSAPVAPPNSRPGGIGFENHNRNSQAPIGFEGVQNRLPSRTGQSNTPLNAQPPLNANVNRPLGSGYSGTYPQQNYGHNTYSTNQGMYRPYQPQSVVSPSGSVQYHPPLQQQYTPPVQTVHHVPMYQPVPVYQPVYQQSSGGSMLGYGGSFLGGYLVGRMTGGGFGGGGFGGGYGGYGGGGYGGYGGGYGGGNEYHTHQHHHYDSSNNNNNGGNDPLYYKDENQNNIYTVHHYHQSREQVPPKFTVPGDSMVECKGDISSKLCVPNTDAICLKNGTIMCVTLTNFTVRCDNTSNTACVYSKIECAGQPPCNVTANQTFVDFYLPCVSNITIANNRVMDSTFDKTAQNYELCVTALAEPKKLESPVGALAEFVTELGKWHIKNILDSTNSTNTTNTL